MEIKISKSAHACPVCERAFVHEQEIRSLVRLDEEGALVREDYCLECWPEAPSAGAYSTWTSRYCDPKVAEEQPPEVFSPLRQTFYEAVEAEARADQARAFLAAQLLRRQKVFRLVKESDTGEGEMRVVLYADRIGNRLIEVRDPNFGYAELETARGALLARLAELENPQPAQAQEEPLEHAQSQA